MNKNIFVNATSATMGGSLTILKQFIQQVEIEKSSNKKYYIFIPLNLSMKVSDNIKLIPIKAKGYKDRIIWDLYGMKKWSKDNNVIPALILSLQNTAVKFKDIAQIIYLHQPLPYAKESEWNLLKKDERKMWFYKYIYKIWIDISIKRNHYIIVQTEWMKQALIDDNYDSSKILISTPTLNPIDINLVEDIDLDHNFSYFFYPAADYKYKNHRVIVEALREIKIKYPEVLDRIRVIFTLSEDTQTYKDIVHYNLQDTVVFTSAISYEEVLKYYKVSTGILFPSYIETFGLPLIEAATFGKKIFVSDCSYSHEVLRDYPLASFISYNDKNKWMQALIDNLGEYDEKPMNFNPIYGWNTVFQYINKIVKER